MVAILALPLLRNVPKLAIAVVATLGLGAALAAPLFSTVATAATAHTGAIPSVTPTASGGFGGPAAVASAAAAVGSRAPVPAGPSAAAASPGRRRPGGGGFPGAGGFPDRGGRHRRRAAVSPAEPGHSAGAGSLAGCGAGGGGGGAGFLNSSQSNAALNKALQADAGKYTWAAATVNSNNAAGYQLGSGEPVMAIGGFNGTDPAPTLAQFEKYVSEGKIHYFIASGGGGGGGGFGGGAGGSGDASQITSWVEAHFTVRDVGRRDRLRPDDRRLVLTAETAVAFSRAARRSAPASRRRRR